MRNGGPAFLCPSNHLNSEDFPRELSHHGRNHSKRIHGSQAVDMAGSGANAQTDISKYIALTAHQAQHIPG